MVAWAKGLLCMKGNDTAKEDDKKYIASAYPII
ncbi:hypothetical protein PAECIP111802_01059 [Paenibacillus allorhizosphaerae]|uniref:Uncharacterized protein n=1 Tax=Paenibacillus allorhizosphaerae TaxID=2849866 RepID=A0ABM8VCL4_9BACL|nr:hypothetical protein PAECIP111802_01059 [Paenibacillus allorhizosphaerae]